jgi:hypothetical protein
MRNPTWLLVGRTVLAAGVLIAALWVLGAAARRSRFDGDENLYMWRGRYFSHLFLRRDISHPEWGDSYWTHSQPMLTNYMVGGWLWARGYDLEKMPPPYQWGKGINENRRQGRVPDAALLAEARTPMVGIAAATAVLLYLLGCSLGSVVAGLAAAALMVASPLTQRFLVRALSEPPLAFFLVVGLLLAVLGARRGQHGGLTPGWVVALGAALGLGFATKLTGVLSLAAVLGWGSFVALAAWRRQPTHSVASLQQAWRAARGWAFALAIALGVFVLSNPHLYSDPLVHTAHLFQNRVAEMLLQQRQLPQDALLNPLERVRFVLGGSLIDSMPLGSRGLPLEAVLAAVGFSVLAVRTWAAWRAIRELPAEGLVALTVLVYFAGVSAGLLLAWPHYLVPAFLLACLLSGLGLSTITHSAAAMVDGALEPRERVHGRIAPGSGQAGHHLARLASWLSPR